MKRIFCLSVVLGLMLSASIVSAQGKVTGTTNATVVGNNVTVVDPTLAGTNGGAVVNWDSFVLNSGSSLNFLNNQGAGVLNNVANGSTQIYGNINSYLNAPGTQFGGNVYFYGPGGVVIGKGATINASGFLAVAGNPNQAGFNWGNSVIGNAQQASLRDFPAFAFNSYFDSANPTWTYTRFQAGAAGTDQNLWIIGTVEGNAKSSKDYGIGAYWYGRCDKDGSKNIATLTASSFNSVNNTASMGGVIYADSGSQKMWLGSINTPQYDVVLEGLQIWLPRVNASSFEALGGTNTSIIWNPGVYVYGNQDPRLWPTGKKADPNALITTGYTAGLGLNTLTGGFTATGRGDVVIGGAMTWVSGNTVSRGSVTIGDIEGNGSGATRDVAGSTNSIWTNDIRSNTGDIDLSATGRAVVNTPSWVPGTTNSGATWVRDLRLDTAGSDVFVNWRADVTSSTGVVNPTGEFVARSITFPTGTPTVVQDMTDGLTKGWLPGVNVITNVSRTAIGSPATLTPNTFRPAIWW